MLRICREWIYRKSKNLKFTKKTTFDYRLLEEIYELVEENISR